MVINGLLRRPLGPLKEEDQDKEEIKDFINTKLNIIKAYFVP